MSTQTTKTSTMTAQIAIDGESFLQILNRALNVLPPEEWPTWCKDVADVHHGVSSTDKLTLLVSRVVRA